mgnify:CR=1 FL=1
MSREDGLACVAYVSCACTRALSSPITPARVPRHASVCGVRAAWPRIGWHSTTGTVGAWSLARPGGVQPPRLCHLTSSRAAI